MVSHSDMQSINLKISVVGINIKYWDTFQSVKNKDIIPSHHTVIIWTVLTYITADEWQSVTTAGTDFLLKINLPI